MHKFASVSGLPRCVRMAISMLTLTIVLHTVTMARNGLTAAGSSSGLGLGFTAIESSTVMWTTVSTQNMGIAAPFLTGVKGRKDILTVGTSEEMRCATD